MYDSVQTALDLANNLFDVSGVSPVSYTGHCHMAPSVAPDNKTRGVGGDEESSRLKILRLRVR